MLQAVDILHIADKFPENNGGLKDLFEKGPRDRFFLVKFWVWHHSRVLFIVWRAVSIFSSWRAFAEGYNFRRWLP